MAETRTLSAIAEDIKQNWKNVSPAAAPYLSAMSRIHGGIDAQFYAEDGKTMVLYFLSNAGSWRGEDARRIKAELKRMAGIK